MTGLTFLGIISNVMLLSIFKVIRVISVRNLGRVDQLYIIERLRNDNTTATQRNEQKGDPPLISQLQLNFFTIREIPCVVLPLCCHFVISLLLRDGPLFFPGGYRDWQKNCLHEKNC